MKIMRIFPLVALLAVVAGCSLHKVETVGPIEIVAHRGFWNCEEGGYAQNSVASLKAAQAHGFWGSEFDVQMTKDGILVSNHDKEFGPEKMIIADHTLEELRKYTLPNGEILPTLEEYLAQGAQSNTVLVMEFKAQKTDELSREMVLKSIDLVKQAGLYDPSRICFISFNRYICRIVAAECPKFDVAYLSGTMSGKKLHKLGLSDDCNIIFYALFPNRAHRFHELGMKVNVWTVDSERRIGKLAKMGVDRITTNNPLGARAVLGNLEEKR